MDHNVSAIGALCQFHLRPALVRQQQIAQDFGGQDEGQFAQQRGLAVYTAQGARSCIFGLFKERKVNAVDGLA